MFVYIYFFLLCKRHFVGYIVHHIQCQLHNKYDMQLLCVKVSKALVTSKREKKKMNSFISFSLYPFCVTGTGCHLLSDGVAMLIKSLSALGVVLSLKGLTEDCSCGLSPGTRFALAVQCNYL